MSRRKAVLTFDPDRSDDQRAFVSDRLQQIWDFGDQIWASITEDQALRFGEQGIHVQFHEAGGMVVLPAVVFAPPDEPDVPADLRAAEPSGDNMAYYIVAFAAPPVASWTDAVLALGASYIDDVPADGAVFGLTSSLVTPIRELPFVEWVGIYHPAYALDYQLAGQDAPYSAAELRNLQVDAGKIASSPGGNLILTFFPDLATSEMTARVAATGAQVVADIGYAVIVDAAAAQVKDLLRINGMCSIKQYTPLSVNNERARVIVGANQVQNLRSVDFLVNLDGEGEIVGVVDSGFDTGNPASVHPDFTGRIVSMANLNSPLPPALPFSPADAIGHGTHVCGSIAGDGTQAAKVQNPPPDHSVPRGIAPRSRIIMNAGGNPGGNPNPRFTRFLRGIESASHGGARVHNNSIGGASAHADFGPDASAIDRFAYLNPEDLVVFSTGNEEGDRDVKDAAGRVVHPADGLLDQILSPLCLAKNILAVGATENVTNKDGDKTSYREWNHARMAMAVPGLGGTPEVARYDNAAFDRAAGSPPSAGDYPQSDNADNIALFSGRGRVVRPPPPAAPGAPAPPAPPGRVRPDLVAPGTNIISTGPAALLPASGDAAPNTAPKDFYWIDSGTSMAAPMVSGSAVLARQFYRTRFGQLRRPLLLEQLTQFGDAPAAAATGDGRVIAWLRHTADGKNHIAAAIFGRDLSRQTEIVQLQTDVGAHPTPRVASLDGDVFLLHRAADGALRLSKYNPHLVAAAGFGTAGIVTLAPLSRLEDDRRPAICAHAGEIAVVWNETGADNLLFQRFNSITGAALDAAPINIGRVTFTSAQPYLLHNGTQYAVIWGHLAAGNSEVLLRFVGAAGAMGPDPQTVVIQPLQIRSPHIVWDDRQNRYLAAWVSAPTDAGDELVVAPVRADGTVDPAAGAATVIGVPGTNTVRQPFLALHPLSGYVLLWEDDTQNQHFDLYLAFLDANAHLDGSRIAEPGNRLRISDTPNDTQGFAALLDTRGIMPVWQSNDEINSDLFGAYTLNVTPQAAFEAQADPNVPLLDSGRYVPHQLREHAGLAQTGVAIAWAGGSTFMLRAEPRDATADLYLIRTNADGKPDSSFGPDGARKIDTDTRFETVCLKWAESHLIALVTRASHNKLFLFDTAGFPVVLFGKNGVADLGVTAAASIFPQLAYQDTGAALKILAVFGVSGAPLPTIRFLMFDIHGVVISAHNLTPATGTARHGWARFVASSAPPRLIAVWHQQIGGNLALQLNRFDTQGRAQHAPTLAPTAIPGDSVNAVLAARPVAFPLPLGLPLLLAQRLEYGLAWQNRSAAGARWQIHFSQLDSDGRRKAPTATIVQDRAVVTSLTDDCTDPQLIWHNSGYGLAWLQQPSGGGNHALFFANLDRNGVINPAPFLQVSAPGVDVQHFQLGWIGRSFQVTWTQTGAGKLQHMQRAIAVPDPIGPANYDHPYLQPSSALLRATLANGATNLRKTALPNLGNDPNDGYGWGRINLRQSLAPAPPVTFYVRDNASVANFVRYELTLPPGTLLLRVMLAWTDPPLPSGELANILGLKVSTPPVAGGATRSYIGNRWQPAPNAQFSDPLPAGPAPPFESIHNMQQVVIPGSPTLPAGVYIVEVSATISRQNPFQQFEGQPFALVFTGSGQEWPLYLPPTGPLPFY